MIRCGNGGTVDTALDTATSCYAAMPTQKAISRRLTNACKRAVQTINPVAPPMEQAESLKKLARKHKLNDDETTHLVRHFIAYHEIDIKGPPTIAIFRSGYKIRAAENDEELIDHLINAIIGESFQRYFAAENRDFSYLHQQIAEEVQHLSDSAHEVTARWLVSFLLFKETQAKFSALVSEALPELNLNPQIDKDIPSLLATTKKNSVLLLGKDTDEGLKRLFAIRQCLDRHNYKCILIKELPEHEETSLISKVLLCALLSRFVVVENTFASGHLYEMPFIRNAEAVVAILQEDGKGATRMFDDMIAKHPLIKTFRYNLDSMNVAVDDAVQWAEERITDNVAVHKNAWGWTRDKKEQ